MSPSYHALEHPIVKLIVQGRQQTHYSSASFLTSKYTPLSVHLTKNMTAYTRRSGQFDPKRSILRDSASYGHGLATRLMRRSYGRLNLGGGLAKIENI